MVMQVMKQNHEFEYSVLCICLKNLIAILIFVYFAVYFHLWWLVLLSLLFQTGVRTSFEDIVSTKKDLNSYNSVVCDVCGEILLVSDVEQAVHKEMKDKNWIRVNVHGSWKNVCPHCVKEYGLKVERK